MSKTLNQLRDEIHDWAKSKGWWEKPRDFGTLIALCHSELSEALEEARTGRPIEETYYRHNYCPASESYTSPDYLITTVTLPGGYKQDVRDVPVETIGRLGEARETSVGKPEGVPSELADTIIRILDMCGHYGIDIERILDEKMVYNETRSHRHGGKTM